MRASVHGKGPDQLTDNDHCLINGMIAGSKNALQQEMAQEGDPDQYTCISVQHELDPPAAPFLVSLSEVPKGTGRSDFVDALTVAVDCIYRTGEAIAMPLPCRDAFCLQNGWHGCRHFCFA